MKSLISVVIPCHNEEKNIPLIVPEIIKYIPNKYLYEIILIDDGSTDTTAYQIKKLADKNKKVKGIIFHRNFGHQAALLAGIKVAKGEAIIMIDADFQHPPKLIPKFINLWEQNHDLVRSEKITDKNAGLIRKIQRKIGYFIWEKITDKVIPPRGSDFRLISKQIARYLSSSGENEIFLRGNVILVARNPAVVKYKVGRRKHGKSSYSTKMFINMFINGFISFSTKPLRSASILGILIFLSLGIFLLVDIVRAFTAGERIIQGWTTAVFLTLSVNGFLMIYLGILGEYIGVIFKEVKKRPKYLVDKTLNI